MLFIYTEHEGTSLCNRPDPIDYFSPLSEKLVSPIHTEYFDFTPAAIFILPQWLCGVSLKCPGYFFKRTNKILLINLKQQLRQKSKAIGSSTSSSSSGTESNSSSSDSDDYRTWKRIKSVNNRKKKKKTLRKGFLNAPNGIGTCPNFLNFSGEDAPGPQYR